VRYEKNWIPYKDQNRTDNRDMYALYHSSIMSQYLICMFASVQAIMGGDIAPLNLEQVIVATIGVFMGGVINANIFGELTVILAEMTTKEKSFQSKLASINTAMINLDLP